MPELTESILDTIKKMFGIVQTDSSFDVDLIVNINSSFMILNQLGVGPEATLNIIDNAATWADFLGADLANYSAVKTYIYLKVKLMFDPPNTSFVINAIEKQIEELEWRLRTQYDILNYIPPVVPPVE